MYRVRRITMIVGTVMLLLLAAPPPSTADGVAAFPNRIAIENGLRGGVYERTITLENDFDQAGVFEIEGQGTIAEWIEVRDRDGRAVTEVEAPPQERISLQVVVNVPADAPNGAYEGGVGALLVIGENGGGEGTGSTVRLGVVIPLAIDVSGEQITAGTFLDLIVDDGEVGLPHRVVAVVQNSGNVALRPVIRFEVLSGVEVVDTLEPTVDLVAPGTSSQLRFDWETATQRPGDYIARASVMLGELDLGTQERAFSLAPRGTLTRSGELRSLVLIGDPPEPGGVARVEAEFTNTGQIESRAELVGELFLDGVLIGAPRNPPTLVQPGVLETLELFIDTDEAGTYTLIAKVNFEGVDTDSLTLEFVVAEQATAESPADTDEGSPVTLAFVIGAVGVLLLAAAGLLWWRRKQAGAATPERLGAGPHDRPEASDDAGGASGSNVAQAAAGGEATAKAGAEGEFDAD